MSDQTDSIKLCACGAPVHKGLRCRACFNDAHRRNQNARRAKASDKCACGARKGKQARCCRKCNMAAIGAGDSSRRMGWKAPAQWTEYRIPGSFREYADESLDWCPAKTRAIAEIRGRG
jgi:hypothetical protein